MSKLEELIAKYCPDGVEYVKIEDICIKISSGGTPNTSRSDYYGGNIPWLRTQEVDWVDIKDTGVKITNEGLQNSSAKWLPKNCVIVAMYGATAAKVAVNKIPLTTNQACCNLQVDANKAIYRYVYYWLASKYNDLKDLGQGSQSNINAKIIRNFPIPLPPLPVQREIVRILDNFTELTEELTKELTARKKQYEYYRDKLLTFGDEVPVVRLGDIGTIIRGSGLKKSDFTDNGIRCIHYGQIYTYYGTFTYDTKSFVSPELAAKLKKVNSGDIIIAVTSENIEDVCKCVAWLGEDDIVTGGHTAILKHNQNPKFIAYYLQTSSFFKQKCKIAHGTKVIEVAPKELEKILIPLPPLEEQERIVAILDRFDTLCNDLTSGLPAEIEARRKQYEYYRDKLLSFPKRSADKKVTA
ncbi:MAG: Restriction endonuclease subunit S [Clostridium sp.]